MGTRRVVSTALALMLVTVMPSGYGMVRAPFNGTTVSAPNSFAASWPTTPTGPLKTWGLNTNGQLGLSDTTQRVSPTTLAAVVTWEPASVGTGGSAIGSAARGGELADMRR